MQVKKYQVWIEGYRASGDGAPARLAGECCASSFKEACKEVMKNSSTYDENTNTSWGCGLFDNETDARKNFG